VTTDQHSSGLPAAGSAGANSGMSIAGFVTGLLGLLFSWFAFLGVPLGLLGLLGVILGAVALSKASKDGSRTGLAKAGIILGAIGVVVAIVLITMVAANM
jgi:hypothetical protein